MQRGSSIRTSEADLPGDALLKPGDVFFREGPEEMTLEVLLVRVFLQTQMLNV